MQKAYTKTNWQNLPSKTTALGATNLNKLENGVSAIDDRVIALDIAKAELSVVNTLVKSISFNEVTGIFTITLQNGAQTTIDTAMEKIAIDFDYDEATQRIKLILIDGTVQYIDVSEFITNVDFTTSETIQFVEENGKTKAEILDGSITDEMIQPNYLADITVQTENGLAYSRESKRYAVGGVVAEDITDNAKYYKEQAETFKSQAEVFRNEAEGISGVGIATEDVIGLVKGSGGVKIEPDGSMWVETDVNKDSQIGTSVQSIISDDALLTITKIEGATTVTPTNPLLDISPDNVATIISAKDFDVVACGKNLFENTGQLDVVQAGVNYVKNADGTVTANGTSTNVSTYVLNSLVSLKAGVYTLSGVPDNTANASLEFKHGSASGNAITSTTHPNKYFVLESDLTDGFLYIRIPTGMSASNLVIKPQLELGSTPTPYEPYKSNKLTITKELNKLENGVADTRERIDDKYVKYTLRIGKDMLDGSESGWIKSSTAEVDRFVCKINDVPQKTSSGISTHFFYNNSIKGGTFYYDTMSGFRVVFDYSPHGTTTIEQWKTFLQANPVTVLYELAEPIETIVEEPSALTSYKGVTNVFTTATAQPRLTVDFKSELWAKNYLQDKAISKKIDDSTPIEFVENEADVNIASGDNLPTLFRKLLKNINTLRDGLANKISTSKIINTTAVTEAGFVPDALLVKDNALAIDTLNNNLANNEVSPTINTSNTNYTLTGLKVYKKYGWCVISVNATCVAIQSTSTYTPMVSGLPIEESVIVDKESNLYVHVQNGSLILREGTVGTTYNIYYIYPCK